MGRQQNVKAYNSPAKVYGKWTKNYIHCYICDVPIREGGISGSERGPARMPNHFGTRGGAGCADCQRELGRLDKAFQRQRRRWRKQEQEYAERGLPCPPFVFDPTRREERAARVAALKKKVEDEDATRNT